MATTAHRSRGFALGLGLSLLVAIAPANAEDIDLYSRSSGVGERPNVLFILDDSANWSTSIPAPNCYYRDGGVVTTVGPKATSPNQEQGKKVAIQKCALYNVLDSLPVS
jgi:type IV pilus assembly protein PilY1